MRPAVVVMARAPRPGGCNHQLEPLLGPDGCAKLQAVLVERAVAWAQAVAPGAVAVACTPPDGCADLAGLTGEAERWPEGDPAAAAARAFATFGGPVLLATTDMPRLRPEHAAAALLDLREGADVAIGPAHDGGWYLVALREPHPQLLVHETVAELLGAAAEQGLEVGLLRMERDLATPADAAALRADPLVAREVRAALRPEGQPRDPTVG